MICVVVRDGSLRRSSAGTLAGIFYAAAVEAMGRILIENARKKESQKHGGARTSLLMVGRRSLDPSNRGSHSPCFGERGY